MKDNGPLFIYSQHHGCLWPDEVLVLLTKFSVLFRILLIFRSTTAFIFGAVSYNVDKLFGDIYLNSTVLALVSIAANVLTAFAINYTGRKVSEMAILGSAFVVGILGAVAQTLDGK